MTRTSSLVSFSSEALDGLGRALDVGLDDDVEVLYLALLYLGEEVVERDLLGDAERALLGLLLALLNQLARHALVVDGVEHVARVGDFAHARYLNRDAGPGLGDALSLVVYHGADVADGGAGDNDIAVVQRAVLDEHGHNGAAAPVEARLYDGALGGAVRVGLELEDFGQDDQVLKQVVYALAGLGRYGAHYGVAAPLLADQVVLSELLLYALGVGAGHIHLVDGHDDGDVGRLGVVDGLNGLRHDAVVGGDNQDGDVRDGGAAGAHAGEGLVARGVQEGYRAAVDVDGVGADVLGYAAGLAGRDVGVADVVQQAGLAVVDVAHDHDDGGARLELFRPVLAVVDELLLHGDNDLVLDLAAELHGHERRGVVVDDVGERSHDAVLDERLDDLGAGLLHAGGQLADADGVGYLHLDGAFLAISNCSFCMRSRSSARRLALAAACCWRCFCLLVNFSLPPRCLLVSAPCAPAMRSKRSSYLPRFTLPPPRVSMTRFSGTWRGTCCFSFLGCAFCWAALGLLLRLGLSLRLALSGLLGLLRLCSGLLLLGLGLGLRLFGGLRHTHQVLHRRALVLLRQALEDNGELLVAQHLHVVLRRGGVLGQYFSHGLGGQAEVLGYLVNPVLFKTTH